MNYEDLLIQADNENLIVREKDIEGYGGRILGNRIAIHNGIETNVEKACVLAEELGHYYTTTGNIIDQSLTQNRKQEARARMWAYDKKIGLTGIINAYKHHCQNKHEIADFLGVTEEFLIDAIEAYKRKYGAYKAIDNYVIYFEPCLAVLEKLK